jgi:hypothetical protein
MKQIILLFFLMIALSAGAQTAGKSGASASQQETDNIFDASSFRLIATRSDIQITLEANQSQEIVVKVVSLVGQEVISKSMMLQPGTNELNLPFGKTLNEGLYFVMIAVNNEIFSRKFMVAG